MIQASGACLVAIFQDTFYNVSKIAISDAVVLDHAVFFFVCDEHKGSTRFNLCSTSSVWLCLGCCLPG